MNSFLNFMKQNAPQSYAQLSKYKPGTSGFNNVWKSLASQYGQAFDQLQHAFIKQSHYDPAASRIKSATGFDASKYSLAVQNVLWSTAVQHGAGGASNIFKAAGIKQGMSDAEIIKRVYAERSANNGAKYFSKSSASIRKSVVNRFQNELKDALAMLG